MFPHMYQIVVRIMEMAIKNKLSHKSSIQNNAIDGPYAHSHHITIGSKYIPKHRRQRYYHQGNQK